MSQTIAPDPFDLKRFVSAQEPVIEAAFAELQAGQKQTHWMWFVFPQLRGLGRSAMAEHYGIGSLAEAQAYLAHPMLGGRLSRAAEIVLKTEARAIDAIFGPVDGAKFWSSMTLFALAGGNGPYQANLKRWFGGKLDPGTVARLEGKL